MNTHSDMRRIEAAATRRWYGTALHPGLAALLMTILGLGCSTFDLNRKIPWMDSEAIKRPTKITVMWSNTILNEPGRKGVRGFGGRIMFHDADHLKPIRVAGGMTVFAFDVTKRSSSTPDKKYAFTAEQFESHYSKSKLGHSYSIWLPWDEVGGEPRRISLVARFEHEDGSGMLLSEESVQILPGITPDSPDEAPKELSRGKRPNAIEQASYVEEQDRDAGRNWRQDDRTTLMTSDPIDLPASFARRIGKQDYVEPNPRQTVKKPGGIPARQLNQPAASSSPAEPDSQSGASVTPYEQLMERQKELAVRFGRQRYQARRTSSARSASAAPPKELPLPGEPSRRPSSPSRESKDPFDSDESFEFEGSN